MDGMIYNQTQIPKDQWRYGFRSSAATGCGWIAVYNALRIMGFQAKPEELIRYFERQLPLIHGNTGTSLWGPALYFRKWGFPVQMTVRRDRFDQIVRESDACILFYRWRRGWRIGAHFVALHNTPEGIAGYNTFRNSHGPDAYGSSLNRFLEKNEFFGAVLTGIRTKNTETANK